MTARAPALARAAFDARALRAWLKALRPASLVIAGSPASSASRWPGGTGAGTCSTDPRPRRGDRAAGRGQSGQRFLRVQAAEGRRQDRPPRRVRRRSGSCWSGSSSSRGSPASPSVVPVGLFLAWRTGWPFARPGRGRASSGGTLHGRAVELQAARARSRLRILSHGRAHASPGRTTPPRGPSWLPVVALDPGEPAGVADPPDQRAAGLRAGRPARHPDSHGPDRATGRPSGCTSPCWRSRTRHLGSGPGSGSSPGPADPSRPCRSPCRRRCSCSAPHVPARPAHSARHAAPPRLRRAVLRRPVRGRNVRR